jgi:hypothetical protein
MSNCIIVTPPHDFKKLSRWYYLVQEFIKYEFVAVIYGITYTPNFINFRPTIVLLLNAYRRISDAQTLDSVGLGLVGFVMRMRRGSWAMASSLLHDFKQLSRWYY